MSRISRRGFAAGSAGAFASIAILRYPAGAAEFSAKIGNDLADDHPLSVRAVEVAAKLRNETSGRIDIKVFANSKLGGDPAMLSQLRSGALEMLQFPGAFLTVAPLAAIENVAFAFRKREDALAAMDGALGAYIRDDIRSKDIVIFDKIWENGYRSITTSTKPIRNVDDLQGLKIRVSPGRIRVDTFASLGASPTPISAGELYTSLQTKIVEAQENPLLNVETLRLFEVQKYLSLSRHMWTGYWTLVNKDWFAKMPKNLQDLMHKHFDEGAIVERTDTVRIDASLGDKLRRRGMIFNDVDVASFKRKLQANGYYGRWKKEFGDRPWALLEQYAGPLA